MHMPGGAAFHCIESCCCWWSGIGRLVVWHWTFNISGAVLVVYELFVDVGVFSCCYLISIITVRLTPSAWNVALCGNAAGDR